MKYLLFSLAWLYGFNVFSQYTDWKINSIGLPAEIKDPKNEFSSLSVWKDNLYLMSESRIQDGREAKIYSFLLADIEKHFQDNAYQLPFIKYSVIGLDVLSAKMKEQDQKFEGLEAIVITGENVFLSVETNTPSPLCYLLKGKLKGQQVILDTNCLTPIQKPRTTNGDAIYNAGFESMMISKSRLYAFYEYNSFEPNNYVYTFDTILNKSSKDSVLINALPFRITDMTHQENDHYAAINYFYSGDGDKDYRPAKEDRINYPLVYDSSGFHNYCRLIDIDCSSNPVTWKTVWEFPANIRNFNWEGIAAYKDGFFIVNDKYTPSRPYESTLLYLHP